MEQTNRKYTRAEQARLNGARSTGAKTHEGQEKAKRGNFKHGGYMSIHTTVLKDENIDAYNNLIHETHRQFQPRTQFEVEIVKEIVDLTWQINRLKFAVTWHLSAAIIARRRAATQPTAADEDIVMAETSCATASGAITVFERRIRSFTSQRTKLMADLTRLQKTPILSGPSQEPPATEEIEATVHSYDLQLEEPPTLEELEAELKAEQEAEQSAETHHPPGEYGDLWV